MIILIIIFLIIQALNNSLILYFLFKKESKSEKHEPLVKIFTAGKGEVIEWTPPKEQEEVAETKIRQDLNL